jgi:hypothetical protein
VKSLFPVLKSMPALVVVSAVTGLRLSAGPPGINMLFPLPAFFGKLGFA